MRLLLQIAMILLSPALALGKSVCFVGAPKRARRTATRVLARGEPKKSAPGHSYVDGDNFENAEDEVLAMGGDPFFLGLEDDVPPLPPIEDEGGTNLQLGLDEPKKWEWDGIVDDEAHIDID